jgi:hypothetical protein
MNKTITTITLIIALTVNASATTIIALRLPEGISIAADSRETLWAIGKDRNRTIPGDNTVCKILQVGDIFYARSGVDHEGGTGFSAVGLIDRGLKGQGTAVQRIEKAAELVRSHLGPAISSLHKQKSSVVSEGGQALQAVFAVVDRGVPFLFTYTFTGHQHANNKVEVTTTKRVCPGDCENQKELVFMGMHREIEKFHSGYPTGAFWTGDTQADFNKLIGIEAKADPSAVGLPVDMLSLTVAGPRWLQRKPECADAK